MLKIKLNQRKSVIALLAQGQDDDEEAIQKEKQCVFDNLPGRTER